MNRTQRKRRRRRKNNTNIRMMIALAVILMILVAGWAVGSAQKKKPQTADAMQESKQTEASTNEQMQTGADGQTERLTEASSQEQANGATAENDAKEVTAKGFSIQLIDGVTYVDGVLIANKTYDLPKDYAPGDLSAEVKEAFAVLQKAAAKEGLNLYISSAYRSYTRQETLYNNYVNKDGKQQADTYSARPGYSEHQSGLCFDLNTIDDSFANTPESKWLEKHAQEYGFIIRYPKGKEAQTGYQYEPWHLRYLGEDLATKVYNSGLCLEEYFGITSEYAE